MKIRFIRKLGGYSGYGYTFTKVGEIQDIKKEVAEKLTATFPMYFESAEPVKPAPKKEEEKPITKDK